MALGNIYLALVDEGEAFNAVTHARTDFAVLDARPRWTEGEFWSVEIDVDNPTGGVFKPGSKRRVFISEQLNGVVTRAFVGRIEGWPIGPAGKTVTLTVMCKPVDAVAAEIAALAGIDDDPWKIFTDPTASRTSDVVLAARSALLHWGRDDGAPVLVDLVQGLGQINIDDGFIEDSLQFDQPAQPVGRVEVTVKAEWQQAVPVKVDLAAAIGGDGYFGTISAPDWSGFPKPGDKIGDWSVIRAGVAPRNPPGSVDNYSKEYIATGSLNRSLDVGQDLQPTKIQFRRMFFDIDLVAIAVLGANRRETLTFSVAWSGQAIAGYQGTTEKVELECRDLRRADNVPEWQAGVAILGGQTVRYDGALWLCLQAHISSTSLYADFSKWDVLLFDYSPSGGQFLGLFFGAPALLQAQGLSGGIQSVIRNPPHNQFALNYALRQARAKLVSGIRIIRASFEVPWEDVRNITGRERVRIKDPSIPGGQMVGKVVEVSAELVRGVARITIAAAPGNGGYEPAIGIPTYPFPGPNTQGILSSRIIGNYQQQEAALDQSYVSQDVIALAESLQTTFDIQLAPASGQADFDVSIALGTYNFDTDKMIDLEAE